MTIPMISLILTPTMKACLLEESYLLPYNIFCQPISYALVSLNLILFFALSYRSHKLKYNWWLCSSASFILVWRAYSISKHFTSCSSMPAFISFFVIFFKILAKVDSESPRALLIIYPPILWYASQRPIGSWYCTIWKLHCGGHQNDVLFSE